MYIIDTGINPDHVDFGGRGMPVMDFVEPDNGVSLFSKPKIFILKNKKKFLAFFDSQFVKCR